MKLGRFNPVIAICIACIAAWVAKDDIRFMMYVINMDQSVETNGTIAEKHIVGGRHRSAHFIEFISEDGQCSGKSDVSKEQYKKYSVGESVPILQNQAGCVLTADSRFYSPPRLVYFKVGFFMLIALAAIGTAQWKKKES